MDEKPCVLVVEDQEWPKKMLQRELGDQLTFRMTSDIQEAREAIKKDPKPDLIIINARLNGPVLESQNLVREWKASFPWIIIIGTSNTQKFQEALIEAGCDYASDHDSLSPAISHFLEL